jgi:hypothetical protein
MAGLLFRLETPDGVAADPPTLERAVANWEAGHTIHIASERHGWSGSETTMPTRRRC